MAIEKQECSRSDDDLFSLVSQTFSSLGSPSSTETLVSKNKKTNNLDSNSLVPSTSAVIIIDDDDKEETLDSKTNKKRNNLDPNSLIPSTGGVIIINDDAEDETLEPTKKKPRLGSWWDDVDAFDQLSCVVKGLPTVHSCFSSTSIPDTKTKEDKKRSLSSSHDHENLLGYSDSVTSNKKNNQDRLRYGHVSLGDLGILVEDPSLGGYVKDIATPLHSFLPSSSTGLLETEANTNKDDASNKGIRHVSLEELGVSVEDLKSMPWEAFDPTWEIRSVTMDPWLGAYVSDMFSAH